MNFFGEKNKMAIIRCPNCKNEISDRAISCPACGIILQKSEISSTINICRECGSELRSDYSFCLNCGCPLDTKSNKSSQPQQIEVINIKPSKTTKKKRKTIIICIILVIAILTSVALSQKIKTKNYSETLSSISTLMIEGTTSAEEAGKLIHDVWYNTIFEEFDSLTDEFTMDSDGYKFYDDFNEALSNLFNDYSFSKKLDSIKENLVSVNSMMKELNNPPKKYQEAYIILKDFYDAYLELTNLVLNPTGSLQTFTDDFNEADSKVANALKKISIYIE